jgi:hypothetical protein
MFMSREGQILLRKLDSSYYFRHEIKEEDDTRDISMGSFGKSRSSLERVVILK